MLTIFTVPKPFQGHVAAIQRNALHSWMRLEPTCEIILFGDERGTQEVAAEFRLDYVGAIVRNDFGTPLLDSVFEVAEDRASFNLLCYVNADILLPSAFLDAVRRVSTSLPRFLIVGRSWDLDVREHAVELSGSEIADIGGLAKRADSDRGSDAIDFFVFRRGALGRLPPFAVGRPGWDNWMIYRARSRRIAVVDISASVPVLHQAHDYSHVPAARGHRWEGPEDDRNRAIARRTRAGVRVPVRALFTLDDATHLLTPDGVVKKPADLRRRYRSAERLFSASLPGHVALAPLRGLRRLRRAAAIRTRLRNLKRHLEI